MLPRLRRFLLASLLGLAASGCALRATTDFGPGGDEPAHRSVSAGAGPFHDLLSSDRRIGGGDADADPSH